MANHLDSHEHEHINKDRFADSAGVPWAGRTFSENDFTNDDGSANPNLIDAIQKFRNDQASIVDVVDQFRQSRLLVPLVADLGESEVGAHGKLVEKSADLAIVTVLGPDGQNVLPVFSSVDALSRWNKLARPVPTSPIKVALAAASELTNRIVLDPGSETEFAIRRPAIAAIAQGLVWSPPQERPDVHQRFSASIEPEPDVFAFALAEGDPQSRLVAEELVVFLRIRTGLSQEQVVEILDRIANRWGTDEILAQCVDSMTVRLVPAEK